MTRSGLASLGHSALRAALLALLGAGAGLGANALRPSGLRVASFAPPTMCDGEEAHGAPPLIDATAAASLCGRSDVVIADARPAERYAEGHIAGATHLPCTASGPLAEDALARFAGARTIIVYGQTTDEAIPVAQSLLRRHHADVRVLEGGFSGWAKAGLACASGPCDECTTSLR